MTRYSNYNFFDLSPLNFIEGENNNIKADQNPFFLLQVGLGLELVCLWYVCSNQNFYFFLYRVAESKAKTI